MLRKAILLTFALVAMSAVALSQANLKVGIVNVETIVSELPEAKDADLAIKQQGQLYRDTLQNKQKVLQTKLEEYQKQKAMMTAEKQQQTEQELQMMNSELMQYQNQVFGQTGELAQLQESYLEPIRNKVKKAIDKVAMTEGLHLVIDKSSPYLLYSVEKFDVTFRVLDEIKRGNEGENK